jgi:hypothetical protein
MRTDAEQVILAPNIRVPEPSTKCVQGVRKYQASNPKKSIINAMCNF